MMKLPASQSSVPHPLYNVWVTYTVQQYRVQSTRTVPWLHRLSLTNLGHQLSSRLLEEALLSPELYIKKPGGILQLPCLPMTCSLPL